MNDSELQHMMLEIQEHRKRERDFTSLEDQIRCLQKRFYNLDATEQGEEEGLKKNIVEEGLQIDTLREQLGALRSQI
jgi:DnaJ-domain-containing protein 1